MEASNIKEKEEVLKVIKNYANSIACETTFDDSNMSRDLSNIILTKKDNSEETTYYILWGGDIGCSLGTSSSSYFISEVSRYSSKRPFLVFDRNVFSSLDEINFREIKSFKKINNDKYEIISINYDNDDANCCPTLKQRYVVSKIDDEWKILERELIKVIKY